MQHTTIAVDVAKSVFEIAISHRPGKVSSRHRLTRQRFARFLAEQPPAIVVMEACGMAHHWGRAILPEHQASIRPCSLTDASPAVGLATEMPAAGLTPPELVS